MSLIYNDETNSFESDENQDRLTETVNSVKNQVPEGFDVKSMKITSSKGSEQPTGTVVTQSKPLTPEQVFWKTNNDYEQALHNKEKWYDNQMATAGDETPEEKNKVRSLESMLQSYTKRRDDADEDLRREGNRRMWAQIGDAFLGLSNIAGANAGATPYQQTSYTAAANKGLQDIKTLRDKYGDLIGKLDDKIQAQRDKNAAAGVRRIAQLQGGKDKVTMELAKHKADVAKAAAELGYKNKQLALEGAKANETIRHNKANERIDNKKADVQVNKSNDDDRRYITGQQMRQKYPAAFNKWYADNKGVLRRNKVTGRGVDELFYEWAVNGAGRGYIANLNKPKPKTTSSTKPRTGGGRSVGTQKKIF